MRRHDTTYRDIIVAGHCPAGREEKFFSTLDVLQVERTPLGVLGL